MKSHRHQEIACSFCKGVVFTTNTKPTPPSVESGRKDKTYGGNVICMSCRKTEMASLQGRS